MSGRATRRRIVPASLSLRALLAMLVGLLALDNILLLGLLGLPPVLVGALALAALAALAFLIRAAVPDRVQVGISTVAVCFLVAAVLLILGGEGRLFYATADWQVRDAVLADMGTHGWPFDYWLDGKSQMLRAPVGMYLVPALLGGASQAGRDWALLAHNSLAVGLILALGSTLFPSHRARLIALATFVMFSGLDVVGSVIHQWVAGWADWDHIEHWAGAYQYSAHITQLFWVPQHCLAGWTLALAYMLWRRGMVPVGLFGATLPLVAIWSPLAVMGALPFALHAGLVVLRTKAWGWRDVLLCATAMLLAIPALLYLSTDAASVGSGMRAPNVVYGLFILLEVLPFLVPLLHDRDDAADRMAILIAGACLFLMPLWGIGRSNDFQMRASIMPLALIAIAFAQWGHQRKHWPGKAWFIAVMALGAVTGTAEAARALRLGPSPVPHCSLAGVWDRQTGFVVPHASYFAARDAFPIRIDPAERVSVTQPARCWDQPWPVARNAALERLDRR